MRQTAVIVTFIISLCSISSSFARGNTFDQIPTLITLSIKGDPLAPGITPFESPLIVGKKYLFVIENTRSFTAAFNFSKFGQTVFTEYLTGSPSIMQDALIIPHNGKVQWVIVPKEVGEFEYFITSLAMNQQGKRATLKVASEDEEKEAPKS